MSVAIHYTEKYFTTAQAAAKLGVDTDTVKRYCNAEPPRLRAEKVGTIWMIPESEIKRYRKEESGVGRPKNLSR
jgi:excisionase family DNA binding protein